MSRGTRRIVTLESAMLHSVPRKHSRSMASRLDEILMHEDMISFARGLCLRVSSIVDETCRVLADAYPQFKDLPLNETALLELDSSSESYSFEFFPTPLGGKS